MLACPQKEQRGVEQVLQAMDRSRSGHFSTAIFVPFEMSLKIFEFSND